MKKVLVTALILSMAGMYSCKNETPATDATATETPAATSADPAAAPADPNAPATQNAPIQIQQGAPAGATQAGMNPKHGAPGHDCSIPEGAPLSTGKMAGGPGTTSPQATPSAAPTSAPIQMGAPTQSGSVAAGTNPAHGEPGHDCSIPVGAPLKK